MKKTELKTGQSKLDKAFEKIVSSDDRGKYTVISRMLHKPYHVVVQHIWAPGIYGDWGTALDHWRGKMEDSNLDEYKDYEIIAGFKGHVKDLTKHTED